MKHELWLGVKGSQLQVSQYKWHWKSEIFSLIGDVDVQYSQASKAGPKAPAKKAKKSGEGATANENTQVESPSPKKSRKKKAAKKASQSEMEVKP